MTSHLTNHVIITFIILRYSGFSLLICFALWYTMYNCPMVMKVINMVWRGMVVGLLACELWVVVCYVLPVLPLISSRSQLSHVLLCLLTCFSRLCKYYRVDVLLRRLLKKICIQMLIQRGQRHWWLLFLLFFASVILRPCLVDVLLKKLLKKICMPVLVQ